MSYVCQIIDKILIQNIGIFLETTSSIFEEYSRELFYKHYT